MIHVKISSVYISCMYCCSYKLLYVDFSQLFKRAETLFLLFLYKSLCKSIAIFCVHVFHCLLTKFVCIFCFSISIVWSKPMPERGSVSNAHQWWQLLHVSMSNSYKWYCQFQQGILHWFLEKFELKASKHQILKAKCLNFEFHLILHVLQSTNNWVTCTS